MGKAREIQELRLLVEALCKEVDSLMGVTQGMAQVSGEGADAILALQARHDELRDKVQGLAGALLGITHPFDRLIQMVGEHREAILHLADRLDKIDGGGRPDLGELGGGSSGPD